MNANNDNTPWQGLREWWADPPRTGIRRFIAPWQYRHLRFFAGLDITFGLVAVGLAITTLVAGGSGAATYGWTLAFLALAAVLFSFGYWLLSIARSEDARQRPTG
jgi:CHASE2 domain-containing sensor protein